MSLKLVTPLGQFEAVRPYIRSIVALVIYLRWAKQPTDVKYCYTEADTFLNQLASDLGKAQRDEENRVQGAANRQTGR